MNGTLIAVNLMTDEIPVVGEVVIVGDRHLPGRQLPLPPLGRVPRRRRHLGHATVDTVKWVGHTASDVAHDVGDVASSVTHDVGDAASDAWDGVKSLF